MLYLTLAAVLVQLLEPATAGLVGAGRCSWGPKYWCATIPQAAECDAVTHCISSVWVKERVERDEDEICEICKNMVGQARDTLQSNETQEELLEVLDGSCNLLPIKLIRTECCNLVEQFIPELVETLASEMNPDTVCTVAGMCNSERIDAMLNQAQIEENVPSCPACESQIDEIRSKLFKLSDTQIEMKLLEACGYLGSYSDSCMYTVSTELKEIINVIDTGLTPSLCSEKDLCPKLNVVSNAVRGDIPCEFCEHVVKHWIDVYASDSSIQEFKALLDGICDKLDTKNSAHCKHIVDDFYIPAFEYIRTLNPELVCSFVGLCGPPGFLATNPSIPITSILTPPQGKTTPMVPLVTAQKSTYKPSCVICEYALKEIQQYLKDGQTEEEIKHFVENICTKLPSAVRGECKTLVDNYEPLIVQLLVNDVDPEQICAEIKLCDADQFQVAGTANCETCEFVMNEVFSVLSDQDDQHMVINVLESICYRLPASIDQPCEQFVDSYAPMILDLIAKSLTADEICDALDLCTTESTEIAPMNNDLGDTGCVLCEYVISNLDKILEDKTNKAEIKAGLDSVCNLLPATVSKECTQFVESYTDLIIDMLTNEITPAEICTNIGLCGKKSMALLPVPIEIDEMKGPYCSLCEYALTTVEQMLEDKKNEAEIEKVLDVVCFHLTAPVHKQCLKMVSKYTQQIIDLLVNDYTPSMICAEISICVNSEISSNDIMALDYQETIEPTEVSDIAEVGCVMCEFAMQVVDEHLDDEPTIEQIERTVQFLCSYLPGSIADACELFVDNNGQKIIEALVQEQLSPKEVCTAQLNLCPAVLNTRAPLCEFGPELWCASPFHAQLCNAVMYCKMLNRELN
jgi:saposin